MPLIVISGYPCSGKSSVAEKLYSYFSQEKHVKTFVVSDNTWKFKRNDTFADVQKEKDMRAHLKSEVQRLLDKDSLIILDAGNYIKGYRYELYCLSKACKTTHVVLHCDTHADLAWEWNSIRADDHEYHRHIFDELVQRFEAPDSRNRWDSPLFTLQASELLPFDVLYELLIHHKVLLPNKSTQPIPTTATNFVYELDQKTQEVIMAIMEAQKTNVAGTDLILPGISEKFRYSRNFSVGQLMHLRRQFISYSKMHPVEDPNLIGNIFVQYLNTSLN